MERESGVKQERKKHEGAVQGGHVTGATDLARAGYSRKHWEQMRSHLQDLSSETVKVAIASRHAAGPVAKELREALTYCTRAHLVHLLVQPAGGLVDGGDDGAAATGQAAQRVHQLQGSRGVQARGRLRGGQKGREPRASPIVQVRAKPSS